MTNGTRFALLAAGLWWGCLTGVGFVAVPMLFAHLPTPAMAGQLAAKLFTVQSWVSLACGVVVLMLLKGQAGAGGDDRARHSLALAAVGMLLALLIEYGAAPHIRARDNLALWHSAGTAMYALQWLCALVLLWRLGGAGPKRSD